MLASAAIVVAARSARADAPAPRRVSLGASDEPVVETIGEVERDRQSFAIGAEIGFGWAWVKGIPNAGSPFLALTPTFDVGLSPGGARRPWSAQVFVSISLTPEVIAGSLASFPDRFNRLGASLIYRPESGTFDHQWLSFGWGAVSTGSATYIPPTTVANVNGTSNATVLATPGHYVNSSLPVRPLVQIGVGLYEFTSERARIGVALDVPVEVSSAPGFAAIVSLYAQIGRAH